LKYFGGQLPILNATAELSSKVNNVFDSTHIVPPLTAS
jgi:hypothetical protein